MASKATLEDILSGAVEIPDGVDATIKTCFAKPLLLSGPDKSDQLWALLKGDNATGELFWNYWPGSCDWVVEWEQEK